MGSQSHMLGFNVHKMRAAQQLDLMWRMSMDMQGVESGSLDIGVVTSQKAHTGSTALIMAG